MDRTAQEIFHELTGRIAALIADPTTGAGHVVQLYSEPTHVSFPLTAGAAPLRSRADLRAHFEAVAAGLTGTVTQLTTENVRIHQTADPEVVVAEFEYSARTPGGDLTLPNVFVMRIRDGEIVESRDYAGTPA